MITVPYCEGTIRKVKRPLIEVFIPKLPNDVPPGTVRRISVTCPVTGYTTKAEEVQRQLKKRHGGSNHARLYCIVIDPPNGGNHDFRIANRKDEETAYKAFKHFQEKLKSSHIGMSPSLPEATPIGAGRGAGRAFYQRSYGMDTFGNLFNQRQLLILDIYSQLSKDYINKLRKNDSNFANAMNV